MFGSLLSLLVNQWLIFSLFRAFLANLIDICSLLDSNNNNEIYFSHKLMDYILCMESSIFFRLAEQEIPEKTAGKKKGRKFIVFSKVDTKHIPFQTLPFWHLKLWPFPSSYHPQTSYYFQLLNLHPRMSEK